MEIFISGGRDFKEASSLVEGDAAAMNTRSISATNEPRLHETQPSFQARTLQFEGRNHYSQGSLQE
jgi:hypothetical protein